MANFANLKTAINAVIKQNGQGEITGEVMNQVLTAMVNSLGSNYQFAGVATPSTNPGTPDQNVFYMATQAGTYTNFSAIVLQAGISILLWDGSWTNETFFTVDSDATAGSNNFITSGAVFDKMKLDGGAYDVTAHNNNATFADLSALLNSENLNTLIPVAVRHGGMSIKFVQSSDNNYIQARCMAQGFTTDVTLWQGVDNEPTAGSDNFVKSGGVYKILNKSYTYTASDFTNGYFYLLTQGVGGTVQETLVISKDYACLRIPIKAGQTINLKTIGGKNARAYAITDVNKVILSVAPANADYSSGIILNVEQDGYLYVNTTTEFLPNVSVVISGGSKTRIDILEDDVSELKEDVSANASYNNGNFTNGYFYTLTQGVGGTAPNNPVSSSEWACLRIPIKAGQTINLKTIGGKNARAYALTDTNRTILSVAPKIADYSSGIILNVEQDGYLYVNTTTEFLPNVSVVISGGSKTRIDILEDDVSELKEDVSELQNVSIDLSKIFNPHIDLTKDNLKILDIGNSFTQDATHYLSNIIANHSIPNTYSLYELIRGGGSFKTWVDCYNDADILGYTSSFVVGQSLSDVPTGISEANDGTMFRNVLTSVKWDMIIIHQVSTYSADYTLWEGSTNGGYLKEYIRILKLTNPQAKIGFYLVHSAPSNSNQNPDHSSLLRWQKISKSVKWMMANYGVDFIIPYGTAIQNIRQCSIVDSNELSDDGRHNASGLADYTASCCYFQQLFGARNGVNVMGDTFRITVDETVAGQISVTDDTAPLAQKAAFLACCDAFSINNPEEGIL